MSTLTPPSPARAATPVAAAELAFVAGVMSFAAATVHAAAGFDHAATAPIHSAGFAIVAGVQAVLGFLLVQGEAGARFLRPACMLSLLVAAGWGVSRTVGLPFGPGPWVAEPVGIIDALTTLDEIFIAFIAVEARRGKGGFLLEQVGLLVGGLAFLSLFFSGVTH